MSEDYPSGMVGMLARERTLITAGRAPACEHTCDCHGGYICARARHAEDTFHLGHQGDGSLVQWTGPCPPQRTDADGNPLTDDQVAERAAASRQANTAAMLATIDVDTLAAALKARDAA